MYNTRVTRVRATFGLMVSWAGFRSYSGGISVENPPGSLFFRSFGGIFAVFSPNRIARVALLSFGFKRSGRSLTFIRVAPEGVIRAEVLDPGRPRRRGVIS